MSEETRFFVVDRVEGTLAVLVGDDRATLDVPLADLPRGAREDAVLRVPVRGGQPDWSLAVVDRAERRRRLAQSRQALDELRKRDPGGDVSL
jgi:hypothetical protein